MHIIRKLYLPIHICSGMQFMITRLETLKDFLSMWMVNIRTHIISIHPLSFYSAYSPNVVKPIKFLWMFIHFFISYFFQHYLTGDLQKRLGLLMAIMWLSLA